MTDQGFFLPVPEGAARRLAAGWLKLALFSLVGAGLVVILILVARTPVVHDWLPWTGSFKTALVIHVDLSVLVWFLSYAGFLACLGGGGGGGIGFAALGVAFAGAVLITFAPFLGADVPYMNNYVPVLENGAFFAGLVLFLLGSGVMAGYGLRMRPPEGGWTPGGWALRFGVASGLWIVLFSLASWVWGYLTMPAIGERLAYYEVLFWGGGHLLQFTHTQLAMVAWLWLASVGGEREPLTPRVAVLLLSLGALPVLAGPVLHWLYRPGDPGFQSGFAELMKYGGGVAALPVGLAAWWGARGASDTGGRPLRLALRLSLVLFGVGGGIGFLIQGLNVTIPSHYHGEIVAVTVAYMGLTYLLLPRLGFRVPDGRWAVAQLWAYGGGSLLHVFGLAWSGMLGVQRKTAGAAQGLETLPKKLAMSLTGIGGGIAVIGGILFLVICYRAMRRKGADEGA
ncbi:MAG: cytochrome C oxidase subunit I [Magnetococcales bacterium]|nr:cytochrome C oxidase subunit I [Magnetococcales bacterium]